MCSKHYFDQLVPERRNLSALTLSCTNVSICSTLAQVVTCCMTTSRHDKIQQVQFIDALHQN